MGALVPSGCYAREKGLPVVVFRVSPRGRLVDAMRGDREGGIQGGSPAPGLGGWWRQCRFPQWAAGGRPDVLGWQGVRGFWSPI